MDPKGVWRWDSNGWDDDYRVYDDPIDAPPVKKVSDVPGLDATVELLNLSVNVEVAYTLGRAWPGLRRTDEHRLVEAVNRIAEILEADPHDVWCEYVWQGAK